MGVAERHLEMAQPTKKKKKVALKLQAFHSTTMRIAGSTFREQLLGMNESKMEVT